MDGTLVVSKKKKVILVAELRDKKFTPFPKSAEGLKEKDFDRLADEEQEQEETENVDTGAADYDYLLGVSPQGFYACFVSNTLHRCLSGL